MTDQPSASAELTEAERLEAMLYDYVEGTLPLEERKQLEARLAADPALREQLDETRAAMGALRSLDKSPAPPDLGKSVEDTIHRRSGGRFFGRRAFGDRVPFGWLLVGALILIVAIFFALYQSPTGSLRREHENAPRPSNEARESIPKPERVN